MLRVTHPRDTRANRIGKTSILDLGPDSHGWTGRHGLADLLEAAGTFIDMAKIWGMNAATMPESYLKSVCGQYADAGVHTFAGGLLFEYAYHKGEVDGLITLLHYLGIHGIEVSENYLELSETARNASIAQFTDAGLEVVFEFGRKAPDVPMELDALQQIVEGAMRAGAAHVVMEQGEFDLISAARPKVLEALPKQDWLVCLR